MEIQSMTAAEFYDNVVNTSGSPAAFVEASLDEGVLIEIKDDNQLAEAVSSATGASRQLLAWFNAYEETL